MNGLIWTIFIGVNLGAFGLAFGAEFQDDLERDFALRSDGQLQITNLRGSITVQGWAQDRVRVKAKRRVQAENAEDAKKLFAPLDFRFRILGKDIELSAEYGKGLDIQDRIREHEQPKTSMDIVVMAPTRLSLRIWGQSNLVTVKSWNSSVEVRTSSGTVSIDSVRGKDISVLCPLCSIKVARTEGSIRCMAGTGDVGVENTKGPFLYVETTTGNTRATRVSSEQLYVSKTGSIGGSQLQGRIEFSSQNGNIDLTDIEGFVSGKTEGGNINIKAKSWVFMDKSLLESLRGNITLGLPGLFAGEVDLWSVFGKVAVDFPIKRMTSSNEYGPQPINHIRGQIGESGGDQLKVYTHAGNIELSKSTGR